LAFKESNEWGYANSRVQYLLRRGNRKHLERFFRDGRLDGVKLLDIGCGSLDNEMSISPEGAHLLKYASALGAETFGIDANEQPQKDQGLFHFIQANILTFDWSRLQVFAPIHIVNSENLLSHWPSPSLLEYMGYDLGPFQVNYEQCCKESKEAVLALRQQLIRGVSPFVAEDGIIALDLDVYNKSGRLVSSLNR
jgi:hypothetical protein